jgi:hypothetical protein
VAVLRTGHGKDIGQNKLLGQIRPSVATPVLIYTPARAGLRGFVRNITVANIGVGEIRYSIFHDDVAQNFEEDTALFFGVLLPFGSTDVVRPDDELGWPVSFGGSFGVRSNIASQTTFTLYGFEVKVGR